MSLISRALIAIFSGIGAGTVGFWAAWKLIAGLTSQHPGNGHDVWLLVGIFAPGIATALVVYHVISRERTAEATATT